MATGIRFCRKSPAVGSMKRHCPLEVFIEAEEKARVAVVSFGLDSAAAEGWRTPPARETGTADVGLEDASWPADTAAAEDEEEPVGVAPLDEAAPTGTLVTVARVVEALLGVTADERTMLADVDVGTTGDAAATGVDAADELAEVVAPAPDAGAAEPPPKENDCVASPAAQGA
jgi:hypothetical protein